MIMTSTPENVGAAMTERKHGCSFGSSRVYGPHRSPLEETMAMRSRMMLIVAATVVLAIQPADGSDGHKEVPVPPPTEPVSREDQPTSPRAVVMQGLHQSIQVNVDAQQDNIVGDAANEPSIAIDPTNPDNIVIGWRQFDTVLSDFRQAGYAYSHDGGATWTFPGVLEPGHFRSDPVLAANSQGDFFYYSLSTTTTAEMFISDDQGVTWIGPISAFGGDKTWMTIDTTGGLGNDNIYTLWNSQFTCCAPGTDFTRSIDDGRSYQGPFVMPQHPKWGTLDVGPDGELYVVGATLDGSSHLLLKSTSAQDPAQTPTFDLATAIDLGGTTSSSGTPNPGGLMGQVWVAVDRSDGPTRGNVYILGSVNPSGADPLDVMFIRSTDGGQSWSDPVMVNDALAGDDAYQWFATMSVSPEGRIDVVWNDTRNDPSPLISELFYAYSTDAGASWSGGLAVSPPFNSTVGHPQQNKIGDYYHMISDSLGGALAYSATFNGEQDVYFLRVGDCNDNGAHDSLDIADLVSADCNSDGVPDECEPDCNSNGVADGCDLASETSDDCNENLIPDECDVLEGNSQDCNSDGLLDECDVTFDLEAAQGWTVGAPDDTATTGIWRQVDPVGTAAQPEDDHTPGTGVMCFVTGQGQPGGGLGDNDIDGGKTTLFSPVLDLASYEDPHVGYWRWYSNNTGASPEEDVFTVDISSDGGTDWINVEVVGPSGAEVSGGWFFHYFRVADRVPPTSEIMLRFVAADLGSGSLVEAAVDDMVVIDCPECAASIPEEVTNLLLERSSPTVAALFWDAEPEAETYDLYRGTQRDASDLACYETGLESPSISDDGLVPASGMALFYVPTAVNCAGESPLGSGRTAFDPCP
jgi:hypothetical protein